MDRRKLTTIAVVAVDFCLLIMIWVIGATAHQMWDDLDDAEHFVVSVAVMVAIDLWLVHMIWMNNLYSRCIELERRVEKLERGTDRCGSGARRL